MPDQISPPTKDSKAKKRIKEIIIRCNREILPFQHVRVEVHATISKEDDAESVAREVEQQVDESIRKVAHRVFNKHLPPPEPEDDLPY